jgi:DNA-binding GntR family transcriptional regulator
LLLRAGPSGWHGSAGTNQDEGNRTALKRSARKSGRLSVVRISAADDPTSAVYARLRSLIVRGQLAPGARLVERDIASRLGTSRTPVRSALQRLQQERYVTVADGGKHARMMVAPLTIDDVYELFEVVGSVEAAAAYRAASLPSPARVRLAAELTTLNAGLLRVTHQARLDQNEIFELDTAFHRAYVEAGAGPRMLALHDAVKPQAERYVRLYISALVDQIDDSIREHNDIIEGLRKGDPITTERAVLRNWRNAAARFTEVIALLGERGSW